MLQVLSTEVTLACVLIGGGGAVLALIVRLVKGDGANSLWRALETFLTGASSAFLAHSFIYLLLDAGDHSDLTVTLTSVFFFIWPGLVNVVSQLASGHPAIGESSVLSIALIVGGAVGVMDGLWSIHNWKGLGWIAFPLDMTWGLAGSTNGLLLNAINFAWGDHADGEDENRRDAHRYKSGFRLKSGFAFSQGAVMSDMEENGPSTPPYAHEAVHVWQNRILGPFFWLSYMGWMIATFIPAFVAGLLKNATNDALTWWTYFDNPWEVVAFAIANPTYRTERTVSDGTKAPGWLCWPWAVAAVLNIAVTGGFAALFVVLFVKAYM
jgi:hypothetical protein